MAALQVSEVLSFRRFWVRIPYRLVSVFFLFLLVATIAVAGPKSRELLSRVSRGVDLAAEAFGFMTIPQMAGTTFAIIITVSIAQQS